MKRLAGLLLFGALAVAGSAMALPIQSVIPSTGAPGIGVVSIAISPAYHLLVTYTNGTTEDVGQLPGQTVMTLQPGPVASATVTMPTAAPKGWACSASDLTTTSPSVALSKETASTPQSVTIAVFTNVQAPSAWLAGDTVQLVCSPY